MTPMTPTISTQRLPAARSAALRLLALALLLALPSSCTGQLHGADGEGGDGGGSGDGLDPADCTELGPPMLRRLTGVQLRNTLVAVFQDGSVPDGDVLVDPVVHGFRVDATEAVIRDLDSQKLMNYAEQVADWAATQKLGQLAACDQADPACRRQFIADFGARVHRQPLSEDQIAAYEALLSQEPSFAEGAEVVIATMLQSPYFIYRREIGEPDPDRPGENRLTPYELASNLSYTLTDRPPDGELMTAAREGRLASVEDLEREARRLLATAEAAETMGHFVRGWLETDDLETRAKVDPSNQLTPEVRTAMLAETTAFFVEVLRSGAGIRELLTAPYTFVNQTLGNYYQIYNVGGDQLQRVDIPDNTRAHGLLGHGSVLTRHALADSSSPVQRGKLVRTRLLCEEIPPPPPNVNPMLGDPMGAVTTRQRYEQHVVDDTCRACHERMDLIGFAFEHYDGFGRPRDQEGGVAIDATGTLKGTPDGDLALDGVASVTEYLAGSPQVEECLVRYVSYYAYGLDGCNQQVILEDVRASGATLESIVLGIIRAPQFSRRAVP